MREFWKIELYLKDGGRARYGVSTPNGLDAAYQFAQECYINGHGETRFFGCGAQVAETEAEMREWARVKS